MEINNNIVNETVKVLQERISKLEGENLALRALLETMTNKVDSLKEALKYEERKNNRFIR